MQWSSHFRTHRFVKYLAIALTTLLLTGLITLLLGRVFKSSDTNAIHLAIAAPITSVRDAAAKEMVQSVQLYLDSVNEAGGINGRPLKSIVFDDKGDPNIARQIPQQVDKSSALVVLGHLSSATSLEAAPMYNSFGIPTLTGTASEDFITQANPYYFRTVFNNSVEGSVVALYIQRALNFKTASIIYSDDRLGQTLDESFETTFKRGETLKHAWKFDPNSHNVASQLNLIVNELAADPDSGIVFLAMDIAHAKDFIVTIRRRGLKVPLFGSQSLVQETSAKLFEQYDEEKRQPGYYLSGVYVPSPLIFDSAGVDAQEFSSQYKKVYGNLPTYVGAAYYDAARIAVRAIQQAEVKNTSDSYKDDRTKIRDQLEQINRRDVALKGLSGPIYFDATHDNNPPVRIAQYIGQQLISAPVQFSPIADLSGLDLGQELKSGNILRLNNKSKDQYFWRQRVAYTGIDVNKLSRIDQNKSSFTANFNVWLRYSGDDAPLSIQFPDAVTNTLNPTAPIFDSTKPIKSRTFDGLNYRLFQMSGEFKNSLDLRDYPFDSQKMAVRFINTSLPSDRLIYVIDTLGLKLPKTDLDQQKRAFSGLQLWKFKDIQYAQDSIRSTSTQGDPTLFASNVQTDYPGFSAVMQFQRHTFIFLIKNLLPLGLLTLVSYSTLYFSYSLSVPRILATCSVLLSGIVLLLSINNQLPEIGYTIALEYTFYTFFFLCVFSIVVTTIGEKLEKSGRKDAVQRLNLFARVFFPIVVLISVATFRVVYSNSFL